MSEAEPTWVLFRVPTPTPVTGETAQVLFEKRVAWITDEMRESARAHGCRFHRCWYADDGSAFYALACWESQEDAAAFYAEWEIAEEEGEETIILDGDLGLVPII